MKRTKSPLPKVIEEDHIPPISNLPREWLKINKSFQENVFPLIKKASNKEHMPIEEVELRVLFTNGITFKAFSYEK
jgi:hypothetical protein